MIKLILLVHTVQILSFIPLLIILKENVFFISNHLKDAIVFSILGMIFLMFGIKHMIHKKYQFNIVEIKNSLIDLDMYKIFYLYLISTLLLSSFRLYNGFNQISITISGLKWVFVIVLCINTLFLKKQKFLTFVAFLFEFLSSLGGFFSDFKTVFIFGLAAFFTLKIRLSLFNKLLFITTSILILSFLVIWTSVKNDYRRYISAGTMQQVVVVSKKQAIDYLFNKAKNTSIADLKSSSALLLYRVQYLYHLSKAMDYIPLAHNFEYGKLWYNNLLFVFKPRILYPNKGVLDASTKTTKYTGLMYSNVKQGASFSLGYFTEGYIDFGWAGIIFPLYFIGTFIGLIYKKIFTSQLSLIFKIALVNVALFPFIMFESDGIILIGRGVYSFLFYSLFIPLFSKPINMFFKK